MEKQGVQPEMSLGNKQERNTITEISNGLGNREGILQNGTIID